MNELLPSLAWLVAGGMAVWLCSMALTAYFRRYAIERHLIDHPNHRSSHQSPTPRGGGMAIAVLVTLVALLTTFYSFNWVTFGAALAGTAIAYIGWLDDHASRPAIHRLLVHAFSVGGVLVLYGQPYQASLMPSVPALVAFGLLLVAGAWAINLYNFIDGIDGLAGTHAVLFGAWAGGLLWTEGAVSAALIAFTLSAASLGFLKLNWPPAKVFLGDSGSGFLGFWFFFLLLGAAGHGVAPGLMLLPLIPLIVDASATLAFRMLSGQRWYTAHREHTYQKLVRLGFSHRSVTSAYLVVSAIVTVVGCMMFTDDSAQHRPLIVVYLVVATLAAWVVAQTVVSLTLKRREPGS